MPDLLSCLSACRSHNNSSTTSTLLTDSSQASIDAHQNPLTDEALEAAKNAHAILLGAIGGPKYGTGPIRPEQGISFHTHTLHKIPFHVHLYLPSNLKPIPLPTQHPSIKLTSPPPRPPKTPQRTPNLRQPPPLLLRLPNPRPPLPPKTRNLHRHRLHHSPRTNGRHLLRGAARSRPIRRRRRIRRGPRTVLPA